MQFNLMNFLSEANPVITQPIQQPGHDSMMRHGLALVGKQGAPSLRDAMRDQALLPETYLAVYVAPKDELDATGTTFDEAYATTLSPYRFGGNLLVHKATYDPDERHQYKEVVLDGLLSGKDYYYGIKLFVAGIMQPGFTRGVITTYGTAYTAPNPSFMTINKPADNYLLLYEIAAHDMSLAEGLIPRFEVVNRVLTEQGGRPYFVYRDNYDPSTPSQFVVGAVPGGIFQRYVMYDVQVRYVSAAGRPVGVSPPYVIAANVQIPWLHNFVDEVILKGGGVDQTILENAAKKVATLTPGERIEMLDRIAEGTIEDIGSAYANLLKQAALDDLTALEPECNAMRQKLKQLLYDADEAKSLGLGMAIKLDLTDPDSKRVFDMITAPADIRGYPIKPFVRFAEGAFNVSEDMDDLGVPTGLTKVTYLGKVAFERFFVNFNDRNA